MYGKVGTTMTLPKSLREKRDAHFDKLLLDGVFRKTSAEEIYELAYADMLPIMEMLVGALKESETHFESISRGLTTDINRVEECTKRLAWQANVEVREALSAWRELSEGK